MAWIGFFALIYFGLHLVVGGGAAILLSKGFIGKPGLFGFVLFLAGALVLWVAWANKPFVVLIAT